jgi:predicted deacylase
MTSRSLALICACALLVAAPAAASAQPQSVPNGPWIQDSQHMSLERLHSNAEVAAALQRIEDRSKGRMTLEVAGRSNEGRPLWLAKVGSGSTPVLYISQQHGNEPLGAEASLELLQRLATSTHPAIRAMRQELTILVVPRVNPDGHHRFWRQNYYPVLEPGDPTDFWTKDRGYDINRWHLPGLSPDDNPVPEAATVQRVYQRYRPAIVVDYHHQGSYVNDDGELIRTSMFWPRPEGGAGQDAINRSKQVTWLMYETLEHYGFAEVSQYPGGPEPGIARNAYGALGSASVLVELRGDIGQKSAGYLIRTAYVAMFSLLDAAATEGTLSSIDPALADTIPKRGAFIDNPHEE